MAVDAAALVLVLPDDTIAAIAAKVRATGTNKVQLLVSASHPELRSVVGFVKLLQITGPLTGSVICPDEAVLKAARKLHFETVQVQDTPAAPPPPAPAVPPPAAPPVNPYTTQVLPAVEAARPPLAPADAEFLDALDRVPIQDPYLDLADDDTALFDPFDDLSSSASRRSPRTADPQLHDEETIFGQVPVDDDWDQATIEQDLAARRARAEQAAEALQSSTTPLRRDPARALARREAANARPARYPDAAAARRAGSLASWDEPESARAARPLPLPMLGLLVVLVLLGGGLLAWLLGNYTTITVTPPATGMDQTPFQEVIPLLSTDGGDPRTAVDAQPVSVEASTTVSGTASLQPTPVGVARGTVTVLNQLEQPVDLPEGTQFVAQNEQGQEVRFLIDAPASVPAAVRTNSLTGINVTFGTVDVQVSALAPGSASNVGENTITQLIFPGQPPLTSGENLNLTNAPIVGGTEEQVALVSDADVQALMTNALNQLYVAAGEQLAQQAPNGLVVDTMTIDPSGAELSDLSTIEPLEVNPPIGQTVDPNNPVFSVTLRRSFSALATPPDRPVLNQLQRVAPAYLNQRGQLNCANTRVNVSNWGWDGQSLSIAGEITCAPAPVISDDTRSRIINAVRGQPRAVAEEAMRAIQAQGLIGTFTLPAGREVFPSFDLLLQVQVVSEEGVSPFSPTTPPAAPPSATPPPGEQPPAAPQEGAPA